MEDCRVNVNFDGRVEEHLNLSHAGQILTLSAMLSFRYEGERRQSKVDLVLSGEFLNGVDQKGASSKVKDKYYRLGKQNLRASFTD